MTRYPIPIPIIDNLQHLEHTLTTMAPPAFAPEDLAVAIDFLKQYQGNQATFEAYRREIERLLQFTWLIEQTSILTLTRADLERYIAFCLKPPKTWIAVKRTPRFIQTPDGRKPHSEWRPFVATVTKREHKLGIAPDKHEYELSQKALREVFTVLGSFYQYLILTEKCTQNPIALIKQKSKYLQKRQHQAPIMRLTAQQWQTCLTTAEQMAMSNPEQHERTLFMLSALYLLYLRISELTATPRWTPLMNHFYQDSNRYWWFKVVGKGNKLRTVAVSDDMLAALKRYRTFLGLPALPSPSEHTPLLPKEKGNGGITSARHIRRLIQLCFDKSIVNLQMAHLTTEAEALEMATVHWLRHTGISDDINKRGRPVAHVRDDAGHSSSAITDRYNDIELAERYRSGKHKKIIPVKKKNPA